VRPAFSFGGKQVLPAVAQLTSSFNPLSTGDPRTRGSVRRASGFVQIAIALNDKRVKMANVQPSGLRCMFYFAM